MKIQFILLFFLLCYTACKMPIQHGKVDSRIIGQKKLEWKLERLSASNQLSFSLEADDTQFSLARLRIASNTKEVDHSFNAPISDSGSDFFFQREDIKDGWVRMRKLTQESYFIAGYFKFFNGDSLYQAGILAADGNKMKQHRYKSKIFSDRFHFDIIDEAKRENAFLFINGIHVPIGYKDDWKSEVYLQGPWYTACENGGVNEECGIYGGFADLSLLARNYVGAAEDLFLQYPKK